MGSKDQTPGMGRPIPAARGRQEPLWSEAEPDDLFDPDLAFEAARARLDAAPAREQHEDAASTGHDTEAPSAVMGPGSEPPPPDDEMSGELPVPVLDDTEGLEEGEALSDDAGGIDTHVEGPAADPTDPRFETPNDPRIPEDRDAFKIGEVAEIVGVRPYVLRYWESELDFVQPQKTEAGQRRFRRDDVAMLLQVKRLRHDAGLTMAQTRTLIAEGRGSEVAAFVPESVPSPWMLRDAEAQSRVRGKILRMRESILELLHAIEDEGEDDG